jgi:Flp pilus assembly protein TadD
MSEEDSSFDDRLQKARGLLDADPGRALSEALGLLEVSPDPRVFRLIALAHRQLGNEAEAEKSAQAAVRASSRHPDLRRASELIDGRGWEEVAGTLRAYLEQSDGDPVALTMLSEALLSLGHASDAEAAARAALDEMPRFARARIALGNSLVRQYRMREAIQLMVGWVENDPSNRELWAELAKALVAIGRFDRAIEAHEQLLSLDTEDRNAWLDYAMSLRFAGRADEAVTALRRALDHNPGFGPAWWALANMAPDRLTENDLSSMERALGAARDAENASHLQVAIATHLDRSGDRANAFEHFAAGKALRSRVSRYDPPQFEQAMDASIERFDFRFFEQRADFGLRSSEPIFIVGLPRSGSTLVERVLGAHSEIEACGELPIIPSLLDPSRNLTEFVATLTAEDASRLGQMYLDRSTEFRKTGKRHFTDKLHLNWMYLPFIRLILPVAHIIDVRRDALDCCWSNFKTLFASGHPAADDLEHIGHFYLQYVRMMDLASTWQAARLLPVRYEEVVDKLEQQSRQMFQFLGLPFEADVLDFHERADPVATMSAEQVRKPINREGMGRWKPYEQWLGPLKDALGPLATDAD